LDEFCLFSASSSIRIQGNIQSCFRRTPACPTSPS
jgi:hypothetical protein